MTGHAPDTFFPCPYEIQSLMEITEQNWPDLRQQLEQSDVEVMRLASTYMVGRYMIRQDTARRLVRRGKVSEALVRKLRKHGV